MTRKIKRLVGCPDAYGDISDLVRKHNPVALLDVGCHIGNTIERILDEDEILIHGFEPTSATFERVTTRYANKRNVEIHNLALSSQSGTAEFFCNVNEQTNSLLDNDIGNKETWGNYTDHIDRETVQTMRLDDWIQAHLPTGNIIIKSDIQGAEGLLVEGGRETLANRTIAIFSEAQLGAMYAGQTDFCDLHRLLTNELGFVLNNIYPCYQDSSGRAMQTDAMWLNSKYLDDTDDR